MSLIQLGAVHVAMERGVADRHFRLLPVVTTIAPVLLEIAINSVPRVRACRFSS
jgi:hypothetical protein